MSLIQFLAAAAAFSLAATPAVAAPPNPAAKLSLAKQDTRSAAPARGVARPRNTLLIVGLGAVAVVVAALAMGKSDSKPASS